MDKEREILQEIENLPEGTKREYANLINFIKSDLKTLEGIDKEALKNAIAEDINAHANRVMKRICMFLR